MKEYNSAYDRNVCTQFSYKNMKRKIKKYNSKLRSQNILISFLNIERNKSEAAYVYF